MKMQALVCSVLLVAGTAFGSMPKQGILEHKDDAVKIAEVLLSRLYGEKVLSQRPFNAKLSDGFWIVEGTLHCPAGSTCKGGVARIEIGKQDGRVRSVSHER